MATRTHAITHSAVFARIFDGTRASDEFVATALTHKLLHGVAAQDAFVALFDEFDDFEEMAWEAAKAPITQAEARPRARQSTQRGGASRTRKSSATTRRRSPGEANAAR